MAEHRGRYAAFASRLASAGYVVWAHDHRGHGTNVRLGKGHFADGDGWRALVHDTITVTRRLAVEYPSTPVFLFGHSMGSFSGQTLMSERAVDYAGVVLAGSNGPATASHCLAMVLAMFERRFRGRREQSRWLNALLRRTYNRQFQPARAPADWLTRDEREVDAALADALCGIRLTTQSWVDFARGLLALDAPRRFTRVPKSLPILILSGARDPVGQNRRGAARLARGLERSGALDVTLRLYPLAPHELVNETNRDEVTRDVIDCLNARSSHRGVGIDGSSKTREAGCTDISGAFRLDGHAVSPAGVPRAVLSEQVLRGRVT
jgi:alpha-beta hydrolase superfamily lysophospholipase